MLFELTPSSGSYDTERSRHFSGGLVCQIAQKGCFLGIGGNWRSCAKGGLIAYRHGRYRPTQTGPARWTHRHRSLDRYYRDIAAATGSGQATHRGTQEALHHLQREKREGFTRATNCDEPPTPEGNDLHRACYHHTHTRITAYGFVARTVRHPPPSTTWALLYIPIRSTAQSVFGM